MYQVHFCARSEYSEGEGSFLRGLVGHFELRDGRLNIELGQVRR